MVNMRPETFGGSFRRILQSDNHVQRSAVHCYKNWRNITSATYVGWRRTKQSGWWEIRSTFSRDKFNFFQHFRWKFSTGSKFSDYIPFTQDGNLRSFEVFRLYIPFTQDGNFQPIRSFPIIFPLHRMEILDVSKFSDYISIAKDGNRRLFEDFQLYSLFKGWKYLTIRSFLLVFPIKGKKSLNFTTKKITSNKSFEQFYYAHRYWTIVFNV